MIGVDKSGEIRRAYRAIAKSYCEIRFLLYGKAKRCSRRVWGSAGGNGAAAEGSRDTRM
jgi:hypothetical protein